VIFVNNKSTRALVKFALLQHFPKMVKPTWIYLHFLYRGVQSTCLLA